MATYERIEQELAKAEAEKQKAENELQAFKEDENGGKWLEKLKGKERMGTIT